MSTLAYIPIDRTHQLRKTVNPVLPVWCALGLLMALSLEIAPTSVSGQSLNNLLFFSTILALAALGQYLVILGGGIDLSVASQIGLAGVMFGYLQNHGDSILVSVLLTIVACVALGAVNAIAVTVVRINPLIATLGVGSLALGAAYTVPGSQVASTLPLDVTNLVITRSLLGFVARPTVLALALAALIALLVNRAVMGRRLMAVGATPSAARVMGIHVDAYRAAPYMLASVLFALCGVTLAGVSFAPSPTMGEQYLLPSIAAVVVGGTALGGGRGSVAATLGGSAFITYLDSLTLQLGASEPVQLMVQGAVIVAGVALYGVKLSRLKLWTRKVIINEGA